MTKTIESLFRWQPSGNYANLKKRLRMTKWHPLDFYYWWSQEPESIKKHCIYSESHLTHLAAGILRSGSIFDIIL